MSGRPRGIVGWGGALLALCSLSALSGLAGCKSREQKAQEAVAEGRTALGLGKLEEAGRAFERAQTLQPNLAAAVLVEAEVLTKQKNVEHALQVLEHCTEPSCSDFSQKLLAGWLEEGQRSPLSEPAAKHFMQWGLLFTAAGGELPISCK